MYYAKTLVKSLQREKGLALFCDLHGHSRARGSFVYGCRCLEAPELTRLFPYILSRINPHFSFESSRFGMQSCKARTARVVLFRELENVAAVYTLEASFSDTLQGRPYTPHLLKGLGRDVCRALIPYCGLNVPFSLPIHTAT